MAGSNLYRGGQACFVQNGPYLFLKIYVDFVSLPWAFTTLEDS